VPVVVRGAMESWRALRHWGDMDYLLQVGRAWQQLAEGSCLPESFSRSGSSTHQQGVCW
jgi:hypothetical protein